MRNKKEMTELQNTKLFALKLIWTVLGAGGVLIFCGCGKGCGQTFTCSSSTVEKSDMSYCSVPLCGGCFSSEWGCTSCIWGENCAVANVSGENEKTIMCSEYYYGNTCFGCGSNQESVYAGATLGDDLKGCYCGSTSSDSEYICGIFDGCLCAEKNDENELAGVSEMIEWAINAAKFEGETNESETGE